MSVVVITEERYPGKGTGWVLAIGREDAPIFSAGPYASLDEALADAALWWSDHGTPKIRRLPLAQSIKKRLRR